MGLKYNPFTGRPDWVNPSPDLSGYVKLDQSTPQTFTDLGDGTGLMKVTAGLLGLDTSTYLTAEADTFDLVTGRGRSTTTQYASTEVTDTVDTGAVTVNWNDGNVHYMVLDAGANTITLTNPLSGGRYILNLKQPAAGEAGTVTFDPVPYWPDGVFITLTTTNNAIDVITFEYSAAIGKYIGSEMLDVK